MHHFLSPIDTIYESNLVNSAVDSLGNPILALSGVLIFV